MYYAENSEYPRVIGPDGMTVKIFPAGRYEWARAWADMLNTGDIRESSNGRTAAFEAADPGSNPGTRSSEEDMPKGDPFGPRVGDDVLYMSAGSKDGRYPSTERAAKIVELTTRDIDEWTTVDGNPTLIVFNPSGIHFVEDCPYDPSGKPYTWRFR